MQPAYVLAKPKSPPAAPHRSGHHPARSPMSAVEEIKERLDVVDVISAYVPLRKSGRIYKALCPFHQEKTPSFVVFPDSGTWRCFGACGTGGDIFAFVMKRENVDFREALEILAQKAGVTLVAAGSAPSPQDQYLDQLREISYSAAVYFHNQLRQSAKACCIRASGISKVIRMSPVVSCVCPVKRSSVRTTSPMNTP